MGLDNIWAHDGVGIAISGMGIVFVLLTLISVFISQLPRFMKLLDRFVPENTELQDTGNLESSADVANDEMLRVAAIAFAVSRAPQRRD